VCRKPDGKSQDEKTCFDNVKQCAWVRGKRVDFCKTRAGYMVTRLGTGAPGVWREPVELVEPAEVGEGERKE